MSANREPPPRVTDEALLRARSNPSRMAAWVLRAMIDELIDRRLNEAREVPDDH